MNDRPMVRIHDMVTNEIIDREMNDDEYAEWQAEEAQRTQISQALAAAAAKKAAILAALADATGYTADELRDALNA